MLHQHLDADQLEDDLTGLQEEEEYAELQPEFTASLRRALEQARSGEGVDLKVFQHQIGQGTRALYREVLVEAYLQGQVPREMVLKEIGLERLDQIEHQRDALKHDVEWGLRNT